MTASDDTQRRKELFKEHIRRLHRGDSPDLVKKELQEMMGNIPYEEVVQSEQELIAEGLPQEEVIRLCDIHTAVLKGAIDQSGAKTVPPGHPVHTFREENEALALSVARLNALADTAVASGEAASAAENILPSLNALMSVDVHYRRKENLLFPYLESHGITAPPKVMWAKHDETRALLKEAIATVRELPSKGAAAFADAAAKIRKAGDAVSDMIYKENQILFPMALDTLTGDEWLQVYRQSPEIGYCLVEPSAAWDAAGSAADGAPVAAGDRIVLPSGSFSVKELVAVLNAMPADITFVDADDTVRYFSQGRERIFDRNRAVIGRKVQLCHPPKSVHVVEKILDDFRSGRQERAAFWITLGGRFIHIEYVALRDETGAYLGTLEFTQDLTAKKKLEGERRLLEYG